MKISIKKFICILAIILGFIIIPGCGSGQPDEDAAALTGAEIISLRADDEDDQYLNVELEFDRAVSINQDKYQSLRVTVAGNRKKDFTIAAGDTDNCVIVSIPVTAVTNGIVNISRSETAVSINAITDEHGKAVADFTIKGTTPSGVTLSTVSEEAGTVVKNVDTDWNLRSICWIGIFADDTLVQPLESDTEECLDGYVAVHGHDFLIEDQEKIAGKIVESLERYYDSSYKFSSNGSEVTITGPDSSADLDLRIYDYIEINGVRHEN